MVASRGPRPMRDDGGCAGEQGARGSPRGHGRAGNHPRMLLDVSRATASHRDLPSLLHDLAGLLRRVASFDGLGLVLHDPASDIMRVHTLVGLRPVPQAENGLAVAESPTGLGWRTQQPPGVPRTDPETRFPAST